MRHALAALALLPCAALAQDATELAKKTQNPVADLITLPFQFNFNSGGDLGDETLFNLNFQPVLPISVNAKWTLIARGIVPFLDIPAGDEKEAGFSDIQAQLYFTPKDAGALIWGVGPVFSLPAATNEFARTGTFAAGVGGVVVKMIGPWVIGGLVNQFFPVDDSGGDPEFSQLQMQPFVNYNFGGGWAASFAPLIFANWDENDSDERWSIPIGGGITKTTVFNKRPMNLSFQYYRFIEHPTGAADNQFRFGVALLYPK